MTFPRSRRLLTGHGHRASHRVTRAGGKPPRKTGCPLFVLLLPLLPLYLLFAWWNRRATPTPPEWPPPHSRGKTARPRHDLSDAAEHYAREAKQARKRAGGFSLGDPVRKRNGKDAR